MSRIYIPLALVLAVATTTAILHALPRAQQLNPPAERITTTMDGEEQPDSCQRAAAISRTYGIASAEQRSMALRLLGSLRGVTSVTDDSKAGTVTVTALASTFCPWTAGKVLSLHGIEATVADEQTPTDSDASTPPASPRGTCPYSGADSPPTDMRRI
ncbi:MAG TPA: hypothetical protein PK916_11565 [Bacteroidota bacterium]|nr:hypothetical protein [Bacteroidota bacterium]